VKVLGKMAREGCCEYCGRPLAEDETVKIFATGNELWFNHYPACPKERRKKHRRMAAHDRRAKRMAEIAV
jgi:5-methylcytosine-specific restriction endonuclease McrA